MNRIALIVEMMPCPLNSQPVKPVGVGESCAKFNLVTGGKSETCSKTNQRAVASVTRHDDELPSVPSRYLMDHFMSVRMPGSIPLRSCVESMFPVISAIGYVPVPSVNSFQNPRRSGAKRICIPRTPWPRSGPAMCAGRLVKERRPLINQHTQDHASICRTRTKEVGSLRVDTFKSYRHTHECSFQSLGM